VSTISDRRLDVAETVAAALPNVPVWAYPPNNLAAPCAFVQLGAAISQPIADRWNAELTVTLVAPGGDNDSAILALEAMIMECALAISRDHLAPVTWQAPGLVTISGQAYFSARLTVPIDIEPGQVSEPPAPPQRVTVIETETHAGGYTMGQKMRFAVNGYVIGVSVLTPFGTSQGGFEGHIWADGTNQLLGSKTGAAIGEQWVDFIFDNPVPVTAQTAYMVTCYAPDAGAQKTRSYNGVEPPSNSGDIQYAEAWTTYILASGNGPPNAALNNLTACISPLFIAAEQ
jgi:Domain of unknown function (DUF4082)